MATNHNYPPAMNNLAVFYSKINDFATAIKYGLMSIDYNTPHTISNLASYYTKQYDFINAMKCYLLAVYHGSYTHVSIALNLLNLMFQI